MLAGGDFRHHPTVFRVGFNLRRNNHGEHVAIGNDRRAGFVTGSFNGQQPHGPLFFLKLGAQQLKAFLELQILGSLNAGSLFLPEITQPER